MSQNRTSLDAEEAEALVRVNYHMVERYARSILPPGETAEDLVQQVFLVALHKLPGDPPTGSLGPWLRGIARKLMLAGLKAGSRASLALHERMLESVDESAERTYDREALAGCFSALPEDEQDLLRLRYTEALGAREIAERVGRTRSWVCVRLHRIRAKLRECLNKNGVFG